jgi:outer membrane protein insertion porin family
MRRTRFFTALLTLVSLTAFLRADCTKDQDHRSNKNAGFLITDFTISGTQTLSSDELATITNELIGSCFDENSEELEERLRASFGNRGYLGMKVKSLRVKPIDPTGVPKPAMLEADVLEGPRFRLAEINFTGNHAFTADELRRKFLLKQGDLLVRDKIVGGLDELRQLYVSRGFLDFTMEDEVHVPSDGTAMLSISFSILEGVQYHMGKLEIFAKKEPADNLLSKWELPEGAVFDRTYLDKYIDSNRSLLPTEFQPEHVQLVRDCPDATVDVRLPLDAMDPRSQSLSKDKECDSTDNSPK